MAQEGTTRIATAFEQHKRWMDRAASGLSNDERADLISLVKKLGTSAERMLEKTE